MAAQAPSRAYQANAVVFTLLAAGHTFAGKSFTSDPQFKNLPRTVGAYARAGWYQGSVFFLIVALINYRWSRVPGALANPAEKAIAALISALCWGSSAWYHRNGIRDTSAIVGFAGALQTWAAFFSRK
ncbi:hypothetical protein AJ80_08205 [Polytolypa hystricis UAMH7299]|uniref:Uncharacterized protein n=1 Tax=Polytolypa hystricis (strain UAMH7299) TaxID=1447883 RepID=A0A2B7XAW1_POLH7|nr:hypothetical protein AJ80_08205 [Polytolypa hystricis UAMH7299]